MTEHSITLVVPGEIDGVRARLVAALERLDYRILNEQPLQARRKARNFGTLSTNVLNYSMELSIGVQAYGAQASRVTFFYKWNHIWGAIGDKQTLAREAEAIAALASLQARGTACAGCGKEGIAESRFCRNCGLPLAAASPAELEVLRLTAAANAAAKSNALAFVMGFLALTCLILSIFLSSDKAFFLACSALLGVIVWIAAFIASMRLSNTLNLKLTKEEELLSSGIETTTKLPHADARLLNENPASVTENTTELLQPVMNPFESPDRSGKRDAASKE